MLDILESHIPDEDDIIFSKRGSTDAPTSGSPSSIEATLPSALSGTLKIGIKRGPKYSPGAITSLPSVASSPFSQPPSSGSSTIMLKTKDNYKEKIKQNKDKTTDLANMISTSTPTPQSPNQTNRALSPTSTLARTETMTLLRALSQQELMNIESDKEVYVEGEDKTLVEFLMINDDNFDVEEDGGDSVEEEPLEDDREKKMMKK